MVDVKLKCKSFIHDAVGATCVVEFHESNLRTMKFELIGRLDIKLKREHGDWYEVRSVATEYGEGIRPNQRAGVDWFAALLKNVTQVVQEGDYLIPDARMKDFGNSVVNALGLEI